MQALNRFQIEVGGPQHGGPAGKRLLEPGEKTLPSFQPATQPITLQQGEVWIVPRAVIFGSEELSRRAPGIAESTPPAMARIHPQTAAQFALNDNDIIRIEIDETEYRLPVIIDTGIAEGVLVIPAGYPETAGITDISRAFIRRTS